AAFRRVTSEAGARDREGARESGGRARAAARRTGVMNVSLKPPQWKVFTCDRRFRILAAGRRFGKTYLALIELLREAWVPGRLVWYIAPTYKQAKRIAWKRLKKLTRPYWASKPNETDLSVELVGGGT